MSVLQTNAFPLGYSAVTGNREKLWLRVGAAEQYDRDFGSLVNLEGEKNHALPEEMSF